MLSERPVMRARTPAYVVRRRRRWDGVSWWFSVLFVVPVAIIAFTSLTSFNFNFGGSAASGKINVSVTDEYSGKPVAGATVSLGGLQVVTDGHGHAQFMIPDGAQSRTMTVQETNYEPKYGQVDEQTATDQTVALRPTILAGTLKDKDSGAPIAGAIVSTVSNPSDGDPLATTDANGSYSLIGVPAGAKIYIDAGDYGTYEEDIAQRTAIDVALRKSLATGNVIDDDGNPVEGAAVRIGRTEVATDKDGHFRIAGAEPGSKLEISASGYEDIQAEVPAQGEISATMKSVMIKGIYIQSGTMANQDKFNHLVKLVDDTELNAMVIDVKQDLVFYDTQVQFFKDIHYGNVDMVNPIFDPTQTVKMLHEHGIYAIARMVVFKDPVVADARPDLAVQDDRGGIFRDQNDTAWVNPRERELWDANIAMAKELTTFGFDEIQYDYIRFPSDGIAHADFGFNWSDEEQRVKTIADFIKLSHQALEPTGVKFAVDLFGITSVTPIDQGIGQRIADVAPYVDYICSMIYPSHFDAGFFDLDVPDAHPYDTIKASMEAMKELAPGDEKKLRPWLQDFTADWVNGHIDYGPDEVKAQIKAAKQEGASGWMLWNADNVYSEDALKPATT
jgi:hypothetical protein